MSIFRKLHYPLYFILTLFLGVLVGNKIAVWRGKGFLDSEPYMLIAALAIMGISMFRDRFFETRAIRTLDDVTKNSREIGERLEKWIKDHLSPTIISLDAHHEVLEQASNIINSALKEPRDIHQYVIYIGSGDLLKDRPTDSEKNAQLMDYISVIGLVTSNSIRVVRYIALLHPDDYKRRAEPTKSAYKKWLEKQIGLLQRNPNYFLFHCPRAPSWGSSRSTILTERALLDIVGNGKSGILIRGDQVARALKDSSVLLFETAAVRPLLHTSQSLRTYLVELDTPANPNPEVVVPEIAATPNPVS